MQSHPVDYSCFCRWGLYKQVDQCLQNSCGHLPSLYSVTYVKFDCELNKKKVVMVMVDIFHLPLNAI